MADTLIFDAFSTRIEPGVNLVEASAGTGKTFAVAMLVLRAIVEKGTGIDQILIVTFTVSATEELRERIRVRLEQARLHFEAVDAAGDPAEADFNRWADAIADKAQAADRIKLALLDIDRAPIYTIHGFCRKMLTEYALDSGRLFEFELTGDTSRIRSHLVQDFWRSRLYDLNRRYHRLVLSHFTGPEQLYNSVAGAEDRLSRLVPDVEPIVGAAAQFDCSFVSLKTWWDKHADSLEACFNEAAAGGYLCSQAENEYPGWFEVLRTSFEEDVAPAVAEVEWLAEAGLLTHLDGRRLRGEEKKRAYVGGWPIPGNILAAYLRRAEILLLAIRSELAVSLRRDMADRLGEQGLTSYDDLIVDLADAVTGTGGKALQGQIGSRYRMALIDEFQDTDSAQWHIFASLFAGTGHYLYLIGDPKQAIYRFRGADIFSYYEARKRADRHFTLNRNFRSDPVLVAAINELFQETEIGGEMYRSIKAARPADAGRLVTENRVLPGILYCQLDSFSEREKRWSLTKAAELIRKRIVDDVGSFLDGDSRIIRKDDEAPGQLTSCQLRPQDIAILVRTNAEGECYRNSLSAAGIPAVVASRKAIFSTQEYEDMLLVLRAIGMPGDVRLLQTAMSCDWFGLTGNRHFQTVNDETAFDSWQQRFYGYHLDWQKQGFLTMMEGLLEAESVFVNLGRGARAERRIANILHLIELIQERQHIDHLGMVPVLRWLQDMSSGEAGSDTLELRLESDREAVRIVTMHSAKGLEFPVVFCPSLFASFFSGKDAGVVHCHDEHGERLCDIGSADFFLHKQRADQEALEEETRLAYVAVTRARHHCIIFWADVKKWRSRPASFDAPLGRILFPLGETDFRLQQARLQTLGASAHSAYRLIQPSVDISGRHQAAIRKTIFLQPKQRGERSLTSHRMRTSFSGLVRLSMPEHTDWQERPSQEREIRSGAFDENEAVEAVFTSAERAAPPEIISELPSGPRFGNLVHEILETVSFTDLAQEKIEDRLLASLFRRYRLDVDRAELKTLMKHCVSTPLQADDRLERFSLADLAQHGLVKELEFTLPVDAISTRQINDILRRRTLFSTLAPRDVSGYLAGYIDLVCEHQGRYYIIDYKSNRLGKTRESYDESTIAEAMRLHNYELQYWLYTLAVHRHLRRWKESYRYAEHFGGIYYLFVRGMFPDIPGSGVFSDRPDELTLNRLDRCLSNTDDR